MFAYPLKQMTGLNRDIGEGALNGVADDLGLELDLFRHQVGPSAARQN